MDQPERMPAVTVSFPSALRSRVGGCSTVIARGRTIREIIDDLDQRFPGLDATGDAFADASVRLQGNQRRIGVHAISFLERRLRRT